MSKPNFVVKPATSYIKENNVNTLRFNNDCVEPYEFQYRFIDQTGYTGTVNLNNVGVVKPYGLEYGFYGALNIQTLTCPKLVNIEDHGMCNIFGILKDNQGLTSNIPKITTATMTSLKRIEEFGMCHAFYGCKNLVLCDISNVTEVKAYGLYFAFADTNLQGKGLTNEGTYDGTNGMQSVVKAGDYAFTCAYMNTKLKYAHFNVLVDVGTESLRSTFMNCTTLAAGNLTKVKTIGYKGMLSAFRDCPNLTRVTLQNVESIGDYGMACCFEGDTKLKLDSGNTSSPSIKFDKLKEIGYYGMCCAFKDSGIEGTVQFPVLEKVGMNAFYRAFENTNVTEIVFPKWLKDTCINTFTPEHFGLSSETTTVRFGIRKKVDEGTVDFSGSGRSRTIAQNQTLTYNVSFKETFNFIPEVVVEPTEITIMVNGSERTCTIKAESITNSGFKLVITNKTLGAFNLDAVIGWKAYN